MQDLYDDLEAMDTIAIAISQEDTTLEDHGQMAARALDSAPRFPLVADLSHEHAPEYDRTTAYLIDKQGKVRQIFPMIIHARPSWEIVLKEVDRLQREAE